MDVTSREVNEYLREVFDADADYLGNTPAVCRASYVHPKVVDSYQDGATIAPRLAALGADTPDGQLSTQGAIEKAVLAMLREGEG